MALWSGRFTKEMSPAMSELNRSLDVDIRLFPYEVRQCIAYASALAKVGIFTSDELKKVRSAFERMLVEFEKGEYKDLPDEEDVHSLVERRLVELAGETGKKIHTGRSRNEEVITAVKMLLADEIAKARVGLCALIKSLVKLAKANSNVVMPGFTHMQHAQPILFAHYLCSFAYALVNDERRLATVAAGSLCECPMGSGAIGGTAFPIDREFMARELGFERPSPNSINAISQRDELLETASALSIIMIHLSRYAEDIIVWSTREFGFVEFDESVSTGSSLMPQKKNPDSLELIRGKSAMVLGDMQALFILMKGLPLTYSRDMQEDKRPLFEIIGTTKLCLAVFKDVIDTLKVNKDKMKSALESELYATDMADYLVKKGLPFREAHKVIGKLVSEAKISGSVEELKKYSPLFEEDVFKCLTPEYSLRARNIQGGTGPDSVTRQIKELEKI